MRAADVPELRLTSRQVDMLRQAYSVLLSPLSYGDDTEWCVHTLRAVKELIGVDVASFAFAPNGEPQFVTEDFDPALFDVLRARKSDGYAATADEAVNRALEVAYSRHMMVYDAPRMFESANGSRFRDTRMYQEYVEPIGVIDPVAIHVGLPGGAAMIAIGHTKSHELLREGEPAWQLAELLTPALEAGAAMFSRLAAARQALASALDQLGPAVTVFSTEGRELHRSCAAAEVFGATRHAPELASVARALALDTISARDHMPCAGARNVVFGEERYLLRATVLPSGMFDRDPAVLVSLDHGMVKLPDPQQLSALFALSAREAEIALLLARGHSNKRIAQQLGVRASTVRTHAERIFTKMGVHSRKALGLAMLQMVTRRE